MASLANYLPAKCQRGILMLANLVIWGTSATVDSSPVGLWSENWGDPDGRYRNIQSVSRRSVHSGRLLRIIHRPRSRRARGGRAGTCASGVAGGRPDHNGSRNMVDALHRHARPRRADSHGIPHRIYPPLARPGDPPNPRPPFP